MYYMYLILMRNETIKESKMSELVRVSDLKIGDRIKLNKATVEVVRVNSDCVKTVKTTSDCDFFWKNGQFSHDVHSSEYDDLLARVQLA